MFNDSYSLKLVIDWLKTKDIQYKYASCPIGHGFTEHGVRVKLGGDCELSVQTHPDIAGPAFAETALMYNNDIAYVLNYKWDVIRWDTPESLFEHIENMVNLLAQPETLDQIRAELSADTSE